LHRTKAKAPPKTIDTGAGFFLEENEEEEERTKLKVKHPEGIFIYNIHFVYTFHAIQ